MNWIFALLVFFPLTAFCATSLQERHQVGLQYAADKQYEKAAQIWLEAAELGYPDSIYNLGQLYYFGLGVPQDLQKSFDYNKTAAELGQSKAIFSLGHAYYAGKGTPQNYTEGLKWLTMAAEQGNAAAQRLIGQAYYHGNGVVIDLQQAAQWYEKAAVGGDTSAQFMIGLMNERGEGVTQNYYRAADYYMLAAEAGDAKAQHNLGALYSEGLGVAKDLAEAKKWISTSAQHGLAESKDALADIDALILAEAIERHSLPYPDLPANIEAYVHEGKRGCMPGDVLKKIVRNQKLLPTGDIKDFHFPGDGIYHLRIMEDFDTKIFYFVSSKNDGLYCVLSRYDDSGLPNDQKWEQLIETTRQKKMTSDDCKFAARHGDVCDSFDALRTSLATNGFKKALSGRDKSRDYVTVFGSEEGTYLLTTNHLTGATIVAGYSSEAYRNILLEIVREQKEVLQRRMDALKQ